MADDAKIGELVPIKTKEDEDDSLLSCPEHLFNPSIIAQSRAEAVMEDDVLGINHSIQQVGKAWRTATTIDDVCKLSMTTVKLLLERRRLMLLTLEPDESRSKRKPYIEPPARIATETVDDERERDPRYS